MNVVIAGGTGRLGRRLIPALVDAGHCVQAPPRSEVDWVDAAQAYRAIQGADLLIHAAAYTNVIRAQIEPTKCVHDTVGTIEGALRALVRSKARMLYVSTDYVLPLLRGDPGAGVYAAAKLVAEQRVIHAQGGIHFVCRTAFVTPEQADQWSWVDGYTRSNRLWVDQLVPLLVDKVRAIHDGTQADQVFTLGSASPHTLASMLVDRYPDHPALQTIITGPDQLPPSKNRFRPIDTSW